MQQQSNTTSHEKTANTTQQIISYCYINSSIIFMPISNSSVIRARNVFSVNAASAILANKTDSLTRNA